jgi:predicted glycosyltransferase
MRMSDAGGCGGVGPGAARILLYSHDSWGIGHLRRNLTLAAGLVERLPNADVLIATGSPCATQFPLPPRVEVTKLPSVSKDDGGSYVPRSLSCELDRVLSMRAALLDAICRSFDPHLLVVDHKVLGLRGELLGVLVEARRRGMRTILGLRDILDAPQRVALEWSSPDVQWALEMGYDRLCVYGVPEVFDLRREYGLSAAAAERTCFTGYVVRPDRGACEAGAGARGAEDAANGRGGGRGHGDGNGNGNGDHDKGHPGNGDAQRRDAKRHVLVTVGGGEDGYDRIQRYLDAVTLERPSWDTTILTGPLMPPGQIKRIKRRAVRMKSVVVRRFHAELPSLLRRSSAVVAMCGYNVSAEILQSRCPAIFLPRIFPRTEQLIRASRFEELGLARCLVEPSGEELRETLERTLEAPPRPRCTPNLDGCRRLCDIAAEMLGAAEPELQEGVARHLANGGRR